MPFKLGNFLDSFKKEINILLRSKKNLTSLLILGILILAIPLTINMVRQQQIIKSRATQDPVVFTGPNVQQKSDGSWVATKPQVTLQITSPLGPPAGPTPTPGASSAPGPTASPVQTTAPPASAMFPSASLSVSSNAVNAGQPVTVSASALPSSGSTITSVEFYYIPLPETLIGKCTFAPCSQTWTPAAAGTYQVFVDIHDSAGRKCSNNPAYGGYTTTNPGGWANCGSSSATIIVSGSAAPVACTATYTSSPANPPAGGSFNLNVAVSDTANVNCVVFYQDGNTVIPNCSPGALGGGPGHYNSTYTCNGVSSGSAGSHTIQAKFGQASKYPAGTPCNSEVVCTQGTYTAK